MRKHFCVWRRLGKADAAFIATPPACVNVSIALRHKSRAADVRASPTGGTRAAPATTTDAGLTADTPRRPEMRQLLQQLVWRAKEALLTGAARTQRPEGTGRGRERSGGPGTSRRLPSPRIHPADNTGLFEVEWGEAGRPTRRTHDVPSPSVFEAPTLEESIKLLCGLLAVTLKERKGAASPEFLSPQVTMTLPPLKTVEAVVAPLGRQARLWSELREWHVLLSCASATCVRVGRESATEAALLASVRSFLDTLDALCLPADTPKTQRRHHRVAKGDSRGAHAVEDTLTNVLWRAALICRVMEELVRTAREAPAAPPNATEGDEYLRSPENLRQLARVVQCVMCELEQRVFTVQERNGPAASLEGFAALVLKSFHRCCAPDREDRHPTAYKGELADALLSFCAAYFKMIPFCLLAGDVEAQKPAEVAVGAAREEDCCTVTTVRTLRQCWVRHQSTLHIHGAGGAFWWLRLLPIVLEGYADVTARLHEQHLCGGSQTDPRQLETVQTELFSMLSSMLYFDERVFEERRASLMAESAVEAAGGGAGAGAEGASDARLRRHRGGRSLFKKQDEKEGVLLPSSAEALQMSSRFSSRRVWEATAVPANATEAASGMTGNSPLFDLLVASKDAVLRLSDLYAVEVYHRSSALEVMWLALLAAHRRVQKMKSTRRTTPRAQRQAQPGDAITVERAYETAQNDDSELMFPPFVAVSLRHLSTALAAAVHRTYEMADTLLARDGNIRRAVGVAIVAGTQETLLRNSFYSEALASNWWLRSSAPFLLQRRAPCNLPLPSVLEGNLMHLLAQRARRHEGLDWLKRSTATALECLTAPVATPHLFPVTKQWTGALVLSNLRDVAHLLKSGGNLHASPTPTEEELKELHAWASNTFSSLLSALTGDVELLLLCGYASFIDALFELHLRLGTSQQELMHFGDNVLMKRVLPALLLGLLKSAEEDTPETHAAACESALFVLAELSRFASWPDLTLATVLRSDDSDLLIAVAVYCLRQARRGGGKQASDYGLPAAQLPLVEYTQVLQSSGSVSFLLRRGSGHSYLHVLDLSNSLLPFSRVQPIYGDREGSCVAALQHYLQNVQRVSASSAAEQRQLLEESVKCLSFMANTSISAHVLGYLVRFIEHYLRVQERLSRAPLDGSSAEPANAKRRENAMASLTRVETAPLVLLDYIGYLSSAGSWTMVTWAFNLAETALKIRRKHQLATTTSVGDVATTAILSQLRALSLPTTPRLPHSLLKSILCLSDIMSESPMTLLGFDRGTPLHGLLRHATRGEYRTMLFAMKQAVILVQRASAKYRASPPQRCGAEELARRQEAAKALEEYGDEAEAMDRTKKKEDEEHEGGAREGSGTYFAAPAAAHTPEAQRELRVFLGCLVACFDNVLDVIRGCALQQDILGDELREVLLLALQTLFHVLHGCVRTVLALPEHTWDRFRAERAHLLWVGLCVAGLVGRVVAVDHGRVCFTGGLRRSTESLLAAIGELVEACVEGGGHNRRSDGGGKKRGCAHAESATPLLDTLTESVQTILRDLQVSHRVAIRLGLGMQQRTDLTAIITSLRAFAAASARYEPAGRVIHRVWRVVSAEVGQPKKPRGRGQKRLPNASPPAAALRVPSIDELQLLVESFRDLENELKSVASARRAEHRSADFVVDWACEDAASMLDRVTEDPTLVQSRETRAAALGGGGDDEAGEDESLLDVGVGAAEPRASLSAGTLVCMDAANLLQEEEEEGQAAGGGGGELVSHGDLIEALVRQCRRVQVSSAAPANVDAALSIPQTSKVLGTHFNCVNAVFARCTLAEIVAVPYAELVFGSLELFARRRSPVPLENCRVLWGQLAQKWRREFLEPHSLRFEELQRELLQLVRQRRSFVRLGEKEANGDVGNGGAAVTAVAPLFSSQENVMAQLSKRDATAVPCDVELPPHDDIGGLRGERVGTKSRGRSHRDYEQLLQQQRQAQGKPPVPLDVLFTLLSDLPRGPRGEVELENLARVVATYVARQYLLLRPRSDGNAMNVMQFLQRPHQLGPRLYQRRRLPVSCAHAADVAGWFLTPTDRRSFMHALSHVCDGEEVGAALSSAEHGVFEYMRLSCLYLHLLSLIVHVCHRFRFLGDGELRDGVRQQRQHGPRGFDEEGGDAAQWGGFGSPDAEARRAERQLRADTRQTEADSVNINLLENTLLHFLNVALTLVEHADVMTHRATSIATAPGSDHDHARKALLYADELRLMVGVALQDTLRVLLREAPLGVSLARRVVHRIICSFSCDPFPTASLSESSTGKQRGRALLHLPPVNTAALEAWRSKRPELFVRSPTLLCVLSPSFFNEVLAQHIRNALSLTLTQVVASLHFYLRRPDAHLSPLMAATTSILSSTYVRNAALRLFCEELCGQIVERTSFREALAPPTVASVQQGAAGSVPDEVLIPFLASICREDAFVSKNALAIVLHRSMSLRPDVFGQPPTVDRFARFAIARRGGSSSSSNNNNGNNNNLNNNGDRGFASAAEGAAQGSSSSVAAAAAAAAFAGGGGGGHAGVGAREWAAKRRLSLGVTHADVLLEGPMSADAVAAAVMDDAAAMEAADTGEEEAEEVEALGRFMADQSEETANRTHKHALASLNLTLAEVMETAMHFAAMRQMSAEEYKKARAMIRAADDARHERIAAFRSAAPATSSPHGRGAVSSFAAANAPTVGFPDAALHIEEPMHFGVGMLHIRFALRKIIHVSMRRLAAQQGPKTLSMMVEMLREVDPKWRQSQNNTGSELRRQSDSMLAGTLRVLVARSVVCVDLAGEAEDLLGGGAGGVAMSAVGLQRTERALYLVQRTKQGHAASGSSNGGSGGDRVGRRLPLRHRRAAAAGLSLADKRSAS
ncbi:uncharacterized protein Tco025E_00276 [Trypanosoma conorhini]|uniref:Uncharacterized protein n=1 Tax=Trypanosoma conorhini TaxID=83891 RepID=A0A3R7PZL3_9TRYP|nr:uncharacterized protein Tco025E_00276 [Trypanosoma conorhini]RNF27474.1 hypothetical protein Tco025E_00276 [Trypanosoma conorhini]